MMAIVYDLHNFHCPQTWMRASLSLIVPIRIEMHHHKIKVIT